MVNRTSSKGSPSTPKEAGSKDEKRAAATAAAPTTTSGKKMKQTRLSFAANKEAGGDGLRKRKLSSPDLQQDRTVKVVRREEGDPPPADDVVLIDDEVIEETKEDIDRDTEMIEIIPCEDSNSAAAPTSTADVSLVEEDEQEENEDEEEDEEEDPINESINLDNSSCDANGSAAFVFPSEPPSNANGKPLTPRQLEKWMGKKSRHEERLRQKVERERKLEEERKQREERERLKKKEREDREEAKRKEKEEKEAARQREKEEREKKKQLELEQKNEEKKRREEQKDEERRRREEQKEEERRRKEEEKRLKELEEEQKKKRASQAFTKFFKVGPKAATPEEDGQQQPDDDVVVVVNQYFMPFAVKGDMKLAPTVRRLLTKEAKGALDALLKVPSGSASAPELYLKSLRAKSHVPMKGTKTWTSSDSSDDDSEDELMVVDEEVAHKVEKAQTKQKYRAKYLLFKENRRPAYYGTWQKRSTIVGPRTPFAKDEKTFDYEVESDDEWEEEEPGESLHGSEDEKEKESEDDYEVDNDFFVPHGHLSDEEMQNEDNEMDDNSPEAQKVKLKLRQDEFNDEMKKKTEKIKPRLIGCIWVDEAGGCPDNCPSVFWELLKFRAMLSAGPIVLRPPIPEAAEKGDDEADAEDNDTEKVDRRKMQGLSEDECRDLIRLVHGNVNSVKFLVKEFKVHLEKSLDAKAAVPRVITEIGILRKIKEIAVREAFWTVQQEFLDQYNLSDLSLTNAWTYALTPKRTVVAEKKQAQNYPQVTSASAPSVAPVVVDATPLPKTPVRPPVEKKESPPSAKQKTNNKNSITQFTKVLTTEEKQKQFQSISISSPKPTQTASTANENKAPTKVDVEVMVVETTIKEKPIQPVVAITTTTTKAQPPPPPPAKKRVPLLMSVPRGQAISEQSKSLLIKNFLTKQPEKKKNAEDVNSPVVTTAVPETIVLD